MDGWQYTKTMRKSASFMGNWQIENGASASRGRGFDSLHPLQSASFKFKHLRGFEPSRGALPDKNMTVRESFPSVITFLEDVWQR